MVFDAEMQILILVLVGMILPARFQHVTHAFLSLDALTNTVAESFSAPAVPPPRTLMDVARDFDSATEMLVRAQERDNTVAINFYESIWLQYIEERVRAIQHKK
jgi:hypothetical protein